MWIQGNYYKKKSKSQKLKQFKNHSPPPFGHWSAKITLSAVMRMKGVDWTPQNPRAWEASENELMVVFIHPPSDPCWWLPPSHPTWLYLQTSLFFMPISLNPIKFTFLFNLRFCFSPSLSLEVTCWLWVQNANQTVLLPSLKTLRGCPLLLASSSSSLACHLGPPAHLSDQMFPHPHQLHFYAQTSTLRCSGCMLSLVPASPIPFIHSPGEPHSSFQTDRAGCISSSLPWAHRGESMYFLWNFPFPPISHIILCSLFLQSWWLGGPSGQGWYPYIFLCPEQNSRLGML